MSGLSLLLVESRSVKAQLLTDALGGLALPRPVRVTTGEEAVFWIGAHDCDLCILAYALPGIDGLETMLRLHQRKPDLPIIMLSNAQDEAVAITAFRAGVLDYVMETRGYERVVAQKIREVVATSLVPDTASSLAPHDDVAAEAIRSTYAGWLAAIGRQLDLYRYRGVSLFQVAGGFIVRALPPRGRVPEALEFTARDFPQLAVGVGTGAGEQAHWRPETPLFPTGYAECLTALGRRLDRMRAEAITISELDNFVAVGGVGITEGFERSVLAPFQLLLRPDDIHYLLAEAEQQEKAEKEQLRSGSRLGRLLGRP